MALNLRSNLKREYLYILSFVRARKEIEIVHPRNLLLRGPREKETLIRQSMDLTDGAVMDLMVPWRG